jgi:PPP family 3-phenylpropionic acid transporter
VGLSIGVGTLSEVIFIFFFEKFRKWLGLEWLIILSIMVSIFRWIFIAGTTKAYVFVGIQVLHSEIGLFTMACITFITNGVPRKLLTTAQTIFYTLTYGLGQYLGIMLMGFLFDYFTHPSKLFIVAAFIHIIPLSIALLILVENKKRKTEAL